LYVSKEWHGKGVAQDLMAASIVMAEESNADHVWLGVWERNPRAIAFYRKLGFSEVGDHVFVLGADPQRDIIMTRELRPDEHPSSQ
jgi:ribosomal protein S18 acetylase RimI-like enzyme